MIDWYSRYILSWRLSNTLERSFCIEALNDALSTGRKPEIFNTDQGSQYTSVEFTDVLKKNDIRISMDGRNRALDNIFIERFWRTVKYEEVYLNHCENVWELENRLTRWFEPRGAATGIFHLRPRWPALPLVGAPALVAMSRFLRLNRFRRRHSSLDYRPPAEVYFG